MTFISKDKDMMFLYVGVFHALYAIIIYLSNILEFGIAKWWIDFWNPIVTFVYKSIFSTSASDKLTQNRPEYTYFFFVYMHVMVLVIPILVLSFSLFIKNRRSIYHKYYVPMLFQSAGVRQRIPVVKVALKSILALMLIFISIYSIQNDVIVRIVESRYTGQINTLHFSPLVLTVFFIPAVYFLGCVAIGCISIWIPALESMLWDGDVS